MELSELVAPPAEGRVFTDRARAGLGDVAPSGRVRLDTIARWLQDAAFADLLDSGIPDDGAWIVRRLRLRVERFPRMHETVSVATWCSFAVIAGIEPNRAARAREAEASASHASTTAIGADRYHARASAGDALRDDGHIREAAESYALAWFNLGVVIRPHGAAHILASLGGARQLSRRTGLAAIAALCVATRPCAAGVPWERRPHHTRTLPRMSAERSSYRHGHPRKARRVEPRADRDD